MKHPRIKLLAAAGYLLFSYGYLLLFYSSPLPTLKEKTGEDWTRLALLIGLVRQAVLWPGDLIEDWFGAPGESALLDRLPVLLVAAAILGLAAVLGWVLMALCRADLGLARLETGVFSTAVGLGALSTYVLAVGLAGLLGSRLTFALPAALVLAAAGWLRWRRRPNQSEQTRANKTAGCGKSKAAAGGEDGSGLSPHWLWLATPLVLMILLGGMLPPVDFDVREYHLQVPKEFYQQGRIEFLPHNVYGNMAMGSEMLSLLAMVIAGDWWLGALAGNTVIAAMTPLAALALFAAGRRFFSTTAGVVAAVVYISIPWIVQVSTAGLVEGASACYLLLAVYAVLLCGEQGNSARLLLAGYLAGSAVACKYPAALFVLLPLTVWVLLISLGHQLAPGDSPGIKRAAGGSLRSTPATRRLAGRAWRPVGIFLLAAVAGCGLWFGKNWVLTGNPTYPLLYSVFGGKTRTPEKDRQWNAAHRPSDFSPAALGRDLAWVGLRSEWLSPLVVPLAALAMLDRRRRRLVLALLGYFGYVIAAWWLLTHRIDRFWIPALPPLALLAGAGACWNRQRWWRRVLIALLILGLAVNLPVADFAVGYRRWFVSLERLRRDPQRVDPWHLYFNASVTRGRVLMVGEAQVFDLEVPVLYNTCFDDCIFEQLVRGRSVEQVRAALAAAEVSHVFVHWREIARYRSPGSYGFADFVQPEVFQDLVEQGLLDPLPEIEGHRGRGYRVRAD